MKRGDLVTSMYDLDNVLYTQDFKHECNFPRGSVGLVVSVFDKVVHVFYEEKVWFIKKSYVQIA
jgi:hypothetical protein